MIAALVLWGVLGCEEPKPDYGMELIDVVAPVLTANWREVPGQEPHLQVLLSPEHIGYCRPLPKISANVDGVALTRLHGKVKTDDFEYDRDCLVYEFDATATVLAARSGADATITVTDGTTNYSMRVKNLLVPRQLVIDTPDAMAGAEVRAHVEPSGDVVGEKPRFGAQLAAGERTESVAATWQSTPEGAGFLAFTLPQGLSGEVRATLTGTGFLQPAVEACTAKSCSASRTAEVLPATFTIR